MKPSVRLGRIAGVPFGAHWSVLLILLLLWELLATSILPAGVQGASPGEYWVGGLVTVLCFLGCLVGHEAAHAVVAKRAGVEVSGITVWALGGFTQLDSEPSSPSAAMRIAAAGPLVSVLCALASGGAMAVSAAVGAPRIVEFCCLWLAATNGLLAVFNALPATPLDGGRIAQAIIWHRSGDRRSATVAAARAGRVTGTVLVGLGVLEVLAFSDLVGGVWLGVVGWFLSASATAEVEKSTVQAALGDLTLRDIMRTDVQPLAAYQDLTVAARRAVSTGQDICPVCDFSGRPTGVVSVQRLVQVSTTPVAAHLHVQDVAVPARPQMLATPDERVAAAVGRAGNRAVLLVVENERLVGMVTPTDVLHAELRGVVQLDPLPAAGGQSL